MIMKRLFKTLMLLSAALIAFSCQNDIDSGKLLPTGPFKVTAQMAKTATRVSYEVTTDLIQPDWEVDDTIFGWDDAGNQFTFVVTSVDLTTGEAQLDAGDYVPGTATKLYAIYYPGATPKSIIDGKVAVDLSTQEGSLDTWSPVIMCATAAISGNSAALSFENETAIIGVTSFMVAPDATIYSASLNGVVTSGEITVVDGKLTLVPAKETSKATVNLGKTTVNSDGFTESPVYFAALPCAEAEISLEASTSAGSFFATVGTKTVEAGQYYHFSKMLESFPVSVNGEDFATIEEAVEFANACTCDALIQLKADCTAKDTLFVNNPSYNVTLDLNDFTLEGGISVSSPFTLDDKSASGNGSISNDKYYCVRVNEGGSLNMLGGNIVSNNTETGSVLSPVVLYSLEASENNPVANFEGGTITAPDNYAFYVRYGTVNVSKSSTLTADSKLGAYLWSSAKMNVDGGTFSASGTRFVYFAAAAAALTITDGVFDVPNGRFANVYYNGTLNVQGGKFAWKSGVEFAYSGQGTTLTKVSISGGYFSQMLTEFLANQRVCQADATYVEYPYAVVESLDVFDVNGVTYSNATDALAAVNAATSAVTISLLQSASLDIPFEITNSSVPVTLDLKGFKLTVPAVENSIIVDGGVNFTLTDTGTDGELEVIVSGSNATDQRATAIKGNGNITIAGGTVTVKKSSFNTSAVFVYDGGSLTMTGGTITGARCIAIDGAGTTADITGGTISADYSGSTTGITGLAFRVSAGATLNIGNATVTGAYSGSTAESHVALVYMVDEMSEATITSGTFSGEYYGFITGNGAYLTVNGGTVEATYPIFAQSTSVVIVNGGEFTGTSAAVYNTNANVTVNDGTFTGTGESGYGIRTLGGGTSTLNGGLVISKQYRAISTTGSTASTVNITGGTYVSEKDGAYPIYVATEGVAHKITITNETSEPYIFGGNSETDRIIWKGYTVNIVEVSAGYYEKQWLGKEADTYVKDGFVKVALDPAITVDGRQYNYQVVPNTTSIAEVDGVGYTSLSEAIDAAKAYNGAGDDVTLKILDDAELSFRTDITNANGKEIIIDLNGKTLTATMDSLLTTTGVLTITDKTNTTGKYTSKNLKMIELLESGTINVENCTLENTRAGYASTGTHYSVIGIDGTGSSSSAVLSFNNVKVNVVNRLKFAYVKNGTFNVTESVLTGGLNDEGGGYNLIYTNTGAKVNVSNSSLYAPGTGNAYAFNIMGKTRAAIVIEESYVWGGAKAINVGGGYGPALTVKSGYFNTDISDIADVTFVGTFGECNPAATYTHGITALEYGFKCE